MPIVVVPVPGVSLGGCGGTVGLSLSAEWQHGPDSWSHTPSGMSQADKTANFISSCGFFLLRPCPLPWWGWYRIDGSPPSFSVTMTMTYSRSRETLQNRAVGKCIALAVGPMCPKIIQLTVQLCAEWGVGGVFVSLADLLRHLYYLSFLCPWLLFFILNVLYCVWWVKVLIFNLISMLYQIVFTIK